MFFICTLFKFITKRMASQLRSRLESCSALLESRTALKNLVLSKPDYVNLLFKMAMDSSFKNNYQACWILELVLAEQPSLLYPHIASFCDCLSSIKHESAKRPMAKIAFLLISSSDFILTPSQKQLLMDCALEWLISDTKIATQCYALDILSELSATYPELLEICRSIIDQRYASSKPSFQRRSEKFVRRHFGSV